MNVLADRKRQQLLHLLVEGSSMRAAARVVGVTFNSVSKLMLKAGEVALDYHDKNVREVWAERVQCDEIWSFCYAKERNVGEAIAAPDVAGSIWTWTAIDPDTKLIISYLVGNRDTDTALAFLEDLGDRLAGRVQLTTDGFLAYPEAVELAFGGDVDFAQLVKNFDTPDPVTEKRLVVGSPDEKHISTSIVERQNLTMRMSMKRYTRRTNAFSKRVRNHCAQLALYFLYYNFCRPHLSLRNPYPRTPAMAAGLDTKVRNAAWIVKLIDKATPPPNRPKKYKKRKAFV